MAERESWHSYLWWATALLVRTTVVKTAKAALWTEHPARAKPTHSVISPKKLAPEMYSNIPPMVWRKLSNTCLLFIIISHVEMEDSLLSVLNITAVFVLQKNILHLQWKFTGSFLGLPLTVCLTCWHYRLSLYIKTNQEKRTTKMRFQGSKFKPDVRCDSIEQSRSDKEITKRPGLNHESVPTLKWFSQSPRSYMKPVLKSLLHKQNVI